MAQLAQPNHRASSLAVSSSPIPPPSREGRPSISIPQSDPLHQQAHGTVVVHVVIDRDGNVAQLEPVSGPPELINAAVEAARQWRYKPTILNGDPVEVDATITIAFGGG
ncbi:MAG TPA: energy transducer TonB [Nitrososphaera sp.]|nr:energy transducer TonB [Nitrososphaera sp.]